MSPIKILTQPDKNKTSVKFCITKLSDAQSARLNVWLKEVVRELVSRFPFIFFNFSGFRTLLVTTCLLKGLFT